MTLGEKVRSLRTVEGELRGLGREMSQLEVTRAMRRELGRNFVLHELVPVRPLEASPRLVALDTERGAWVRVFSLLHLIDRVCDTPDTQTSKA